MTYLESPTEIIATISRLKKAKILWMDTETTDFQTKKPKLSLIQVSDDANDLSGEHVYIFDMLKNPDLINTFIEQIMVDEQIEKVFHNASYDLKFLGAKSANNITCTLEMAKKIPYYYLPVSNYKLQTIGAELCNYQNIDKSEQLSDWGYRPLSPEQIEYAYLDCIYLAQIHQELIRLEQEVNPAPESDDLVKLTARYEEISEQYKLLDSEFKHLEERIKKAMQTQEIEQTNRFKLTTYERKTSKIQLAELIKFIQAEGLNLDFPIALTQKIKAEMGTSIEKIPIDTETTTSTRLTVKNPLEDESNDFGF